MLLDNKLGAAIRPDLAIISDLTAPVERTIGRIQIRKMAEWPGIATGKATWARRCVAAAAAGGRQGGQVDAVAVQLVEVEHTEARSQHLPPQH